MGSKKIKDLPSISSAEINENEDALLIADINGNTGKFNPFLISANSKSNIHMIGENFIFGENPSYSDWQRNKTFKNLFGKKKYTGTPTAHSPTTAQQVYDDPYKRITLTSSASIELQYSVSDYNIPSDAVAVFLYAETYFVQKTDRSSGFIINFYTNSNRSVDAEHSITSTIEHAKNTGPAVNFVNFLAPVVDGEIYLKLRPHPGFTMRAVALAVFGYIG